MGSEMCIRDRLTNKRLWEAKKQIGNLAASGVKEQNQALQLLSELDTKLEQVEKERLDEIPLGVRLRIKDKAWAGSRQDLTKEKNKQTSSKRFLICKINLTNLMQNNTMSEKNCCSFTTDEGQLARSGLRRGWFSSSQVSQVAFLTDTSLSRLQENGLPHACLPDENKRS